MMKVACLYFGAVDAGLLRGFAEACLRLSPQLALREGEAVFAEYGHGRLLHTPESFAAHFQALARRFGLKGRLGWGAHAGEALSRARFGPQEAPLDALKDYASPFLEDPAVEAFLDPMLAALKALGLARVADFLALPPKSVGERFGADAAILRERAAGISGMAWPRFAPPRQLREAERLAGPEEWGCEDFERVLFGLKRLLDRLAARLRGLGLRASRLELKMLMDGGGSRLLDLPLALPQGSALALLRFIKERLDLERREGRLARGLLSLSLRVLESAPGLGGQASFFDSREEDIEAWNSLVSRLRAQLGEDQVFLAELVQRYLPERAWKRILKEPAPSSPPAADGPKPKRPSRLLPRPLPLLRHAQTLATGKRHWQALAWEGPERINGEWWADGFDRDYFKVDTGEGEKLWVYSNAEKSGAWWLHGYFD